MPTSSIIFLIVYAVGIIINAVVAASIWDDLKEDKQLVKVRLAVVVIFVAASFCTWIYCLCYFIGSLIKGIVTKEPKGGDEP